MRLTVTELRQVIREVIAESPAWWEKNWAEDEEEDLEDLDPKIVQDPNGPLRWQDADDPGHKVIHTKKGIYDWSLPQDTCISDQSAVTKLRCFLSTPTPAVQEVFTTWKPRSRP